jgi:hypothetical protein
MFLLTSLSTQFGLGSSIAFGIVIAVGAMIVILVATHLIFASVFPICTKLLSALLKLCYCLVVPLTDFLVYAANEFWNATNIIDQISSAAACVLICLIYLAVIIQLKFDLRMLRKKNAIWNLDN